MRYDLIVRAVIVFGGPGLATVEGLRLHHRRQRSTVEEAAARNLVAAVVIDARTADDFARGADLLRALFDNPRRPRAPLDPGRILGIVATGDVDAAFALGGYGIAGVLQAHELEELPTRLQRVLESEPRPAPLVTPRRTALLTGRPPDELPTVTIGYAHAPEMQAALAYYCEQLRQHADESTVFADIATLVDAMLAEGLTCQTNLATKAGTTHTGQFIGSFEYYRELRGTRYAKIPDHPAGAMPMDVFVAVDEVLHEVLHLLFVANRLRASLQPTHPLLAEELSLSWWQGVVHNRVFPEWIRDRAILEINDDFTLCEDKQETWKFWTQGHVFDQYAHYPWIRWLVAQLPERACYIGQREDLESLVASFRDRPEAAFLLPRAHELALDTPFDSYPRVPEALYKDP